MFANEKWKPLTNGLQQKASAELRLSITDIGKISSAREEKSDNGSYRAFLFFYIRYSYYLISLA